MGKFVYPTLPKSLMMLLVYPRRMAAGVKTRGFVNIAIVRSNFEGVWSNNNRDEKTIGGGGMK